MSYKLPPVTHGQFLSTQTQTYSGATSGQTVTFNISVDANSGISLSGSTKIVVTSAGDYLFIISTSIDQGSGTNEDYEIWYRKNGTNIEYSSRATVNATAIAQQLLTIPFIVDMLPNDYVEVRWYSSAASGTLKAVAAGTNPTRPIVPSIILNVNKISE